MTRYSASKEVRQQSGFTLIEIIVVTGVMVLLTGGALAGYTNYNTSQRLKQAGKTLVTELRQAQRKAVAGQRGKCLSGEIFDGYRVTLSANQYTIAAMCSGSGVLDKTVTLPGAITMSTGFVTFAPLSGSIPAATTISLTQGSTTISITISTNGSISQTGF